MIKWFKRIRYALLEAWLFWKYRNQDPMVCCCGDDINPRPGSMFCHQGYCRSMKEYTITKALEKFKC